MTRDGMTIEKAIEQVVDVETVVEVDGDTVVVTGFVDSDEEREAVLEVINRLEPQARVIDNLTRAGWMPEEIAGARLSETEAAGFAGAHPGLQETEALEPGDFTDQSIIKDQSVASGPSGTHADDDVAEGDEVYVPPTDPPLTREGDVLGGFQTTADEPEDIPVSNVIPGFADAALEEAVVSELREDASTTALELEVTSNQGVVTLRGIVDDLEDLENAEAVAARIPGVVEVREELDLRSGR